jgi:hypothetical protein
MKKIEMVLTGTSKNGGDPLLYFDVVTELTLFSSISQELLARVTVNTKGDYLVYRVPGSRVDTTEKGDALCNVILKKLENLKKEEG